MWGLNTLNIIYDVYKKVVDNFVLENRRVIFWTFEFKMFQWKIVFNKHIWCLTNYTSAIYNKA